MSRTRALDYQATVRQVERADAGNRPADSVIVTGATR